jgi:hypothetical protein
MLAAATPGEHQAAANAIHRVADTITTEESVCDSELESVNGRFLAYSSPSRSPDPHYLAVLARPGFVRATPALPVTTRIRLPSAPPPCCDRTGGKGLSPPLEPQRLTAHP